MIIITGEMPNRRCPFNEKMSLKCRITTEGNATGRLKAERTTVREHFNPPVNAAPGCEVAL
jgi:hypothetical protein